MKKVYTVLIIYFLVAVAEKTYCQITFEAKAENIYLKQARQAYNKDFFMSSVAAANEIIVSRITPNGKEKWSKRYYYNRFQNDAIITATRSNGFIFSKRFSDSNGVVTFSLTKCDKNGEIVWSKAYKTDAKVGIPIYYGPIICETPEENIYVAIDDNNKYFQLTKLNKNGSVIWCKRYSRQIRVAEYTGDIASGNDDGLLISRHVINCEGYCTTGNVQKIDKDGNIVLSKLFDGHIFSAFPIVGYYKNKTIQVVGYISTDSYKRRFYYWTYNTLTKKGKAEVMPYNIFTLKEFLKKRNLKFSQGIRLSKYPEGDWIINPDWSLTNFVQQNASIHIIKYDALNRVCPNYNSKLVDTNLIDERMPNDDPSYQVSLIDIQASNLALDTSSYNLSITQICSGSAPLKSNYADSMVTAGDKKINVYPNPSSEIIYIKGLSDKSVLSVTDMNSKVLKQLTATSSMLQLNIGFLARGAYLLRINDGHQITSKTFIKN